MRIAPPECHLARLAGLQADLRAASLDALVVTSLSNIAYLTGLFASAAALVVSGERASLHVDGRYLPTAKERARILDYLDVVHVQTATPQNESIAASLLDFANGRVGYEAAHLTVKQFQGLESKLASAQNACELAAVEALIEARRAIKDSWELETLRDAGSRLSDAAKCIIPKALAGRSERDVAAAIELELRRVGFDKPAFDTIVAAGPNSAVPHHLAGDRVLAAGELVILDFGGMLDGYAVDMSRTVVVGGGHGRERRLMEHVAEAQQAAFTAASVGRAASEVDGAARDVLSRHGLGDHFSHGTGHGLGLEVHERPRLAKHRPDLPIEPLQAGMVFTLEPGAYIDGWGGVRIEDDVVLTSRGAEWLTEAPRL